jgi:hypothetical protein
LHLFYFKKALIGYGIFRNLSVSKFENKKYCRFAAKNGGGLLRLRRKKKEFYLIFSSLLRLRSAQVWLIFTPKIRFSKKVINNRYFSLKPFAYRLLSPFLLFFY